VPTTAAIAGCGSRAGVTAPAAAAGAATALTNSNRRPCGKNQSPATAMGKVLQRLGGFREVPLEKGSPYVQPASIRYELDGGRPPLRFVARAFALLGCGGRCRRQWGA
jgi:hypothetical protein